MPCTRHRGHLSVAGYAHLLRRVPLKYTRHLATYGIYVTLEKGVDVEKNSAYGHVR